MHASILKTGRKYVSEVDEATFIFRCRDFAKDYTFVPSHPSHHTFLDMCVILEWENGLPFRLAVSNCIGISVAKRSGGGPSTALPPVIL